MATITGMTAEGAQEIDDKTITGATRAGTSLILTTQGAGTINVENAFPALFEYHAINEIYFNVSPANPATYLGGGTWVRWGKGRVPVSVDEADSDFDTVEEVGGFKKHVLTIEEMPSHRHYPPVAVSDGGNAAALRTLYATNSPVWSEGDVSNQTSATGGGQPHNIVQPYITVYMWKRTA